MDLFSRLKPKFKLKKKEGKAQLSPNRDADVSLDSNIVPHILDFSWYDENRELLRQISANGLRYQLEELMKIVALYDVQGEVDILFRHSLKGAGLHSMERYPPPRCYPGTRVDLREKIYAWLMDESREHEMLWLFGPAGVGKSAVAQTIGELAEDFGTFGAAIFFSRGGKIDDSSRFAVSIACQLRAIQPSYRQIVDDVVGKNPSIVSRDRRTQFKELLIEPFSSLRPEGEGFPRLLLIIDGLDECREEDEQLELIRLVAESVKDLDSVPFLWLICSRPEHHLKEFFRNDGLSGICLQLELLPQEVDAEADIRRYLTDGLERIAAKYDNQRHSDTTSSLINDSEKVNKLVHAASGVFVVASSFLGFIGDPIVADPSSQMQVVLDVIDGNSVPSGSGNPMAPIDMLYIGVLEKVRDDDRPKTLELLGTCAVAPPIPALHLANLIGITQEEFYSHLRTLHAFLNVPHHSTASQEFLHFFHVSFPDFLFHRDRSQDYYQDPDMRRFDLATAFLHALNSTSIDYSQELSWLPSDVSQEEDDTISPESESPLSISYDILSFAAAHTWELCMGISKPRNWGPLLKVVANFDFRRLRSLCDMVPVQPFVQFIRWLHKLGKEVPNLRGIVREDCQFDTDEQLLEKCIPLAKPLDLESTTEVYDLDKPPRYTLIGFGIETVVVLLVPEAVIIYTIDDIGYL